MRAYLYGFILLEQRESHDSGQTVSLEELNAMGVQYQRLDGSEEENLAAISALCKERKYMTRDDITISPSLIPDYEEKIKSFFVEHIHEDEEVRYVLDGSGYYDVKGSNGWWIRILIEKGDLLSIPAGVCHRFTPDTNNYIQAMRMYKENPKWQPIYRKEYLFSTCYSFNFPDIKEVTEVGFC